MGLGVWAPRLPMVPFADLWALPPWTGDESASAIAQDWYLSGLSGTEPLEIPWLWLAPPLRFRQDKAITYASVTRKQSGARPSIATLPADDEQVDFTATLDSGNMVDAPNLAQYMVTFYDQPRTRISSMAFILNSRTQDEQWQILGARIGDRIRITGVPAGWPEGATELVLEGIAHTGTTETRRVEWSTSPVIGFRVGEVGPWWRIGDSPLNSGVQLAW